MFKQKFIKFPKFKAELKIVEIGKMKLVWIINPPFLTKPIPKVLWNDKDIIQFIKEEIVIKTGRHANEKENKDEK